MRRTLTVVAVSALVATGCNSAEPKAEEAGAVQADIVVEGTDDLMFSSIEFTARANVPTTVQLTAGSVEHDFVIEGDRELASGAEDLHVVQARPGQTQTGSFTISQTGTYEVYCSIPGHREAGMTATLTVLE